MNLTCGAKHLPGSYAKDTWQVATSKVNYQKAQSQKCSDRQATTAFVTARDLLGHTPQPVRTGYFHGLAAWMSSCLQFTQPCTTWFHAPRARIFSVRVYHQPVRRHWGWCWWNLSSQPCFNLRSQSWGLSRERRDRLLSTSAEVDLDLFGNKRFVPVLRTLSVTAILFFFLRS